MIPYDDNGDDDDNIFLLLSGFDSATPNTETILNILNDH